MTSQDLPPVHTPGDAFLSIIAQRQADTNDLLRQLLDRLPAPHPEGDRVELREPALPAPPAGEAGTEEPQPEPAAKAAVQRASPKRTRRKAGA